jgi:hypothetical protein
MCVTPRYSVESNVGRSWAAGVARDGKTRKTGQMGEVGCTIDGGQEAKTEILLYWSSIPGNWDFDKRSVGR